MRIPAYSLVMVASLRASLVLGACEMPELVSSIPDGAVATEAQLLAAQTEVRAYIEAMDRYIACQNEELRVDEEGTTDDYLFLMTRRIESAREEVDRVAAEFNDQVSAFRAGRQTAASGR